MGCRRSQDLLLWVRVGEGSTQGSRAARGREGGRDKGERGGRDKGVLGTLFGTQLGGLGGWGLGAGTWEINARCTTITCHNKIHNCTLQNS